MSAKPEPKQNHLLAALSPEVQGRLFPYLELVPLPLRAVITKIRRVSRAFISKDAKKLYAG